MYYLCHDWSHIWGTSSYSLERSVSFQDEAVSMADLRCFGRWSWAPLYGTLFGLVVLISQCKGFQRDKREILYRRSPSLYFLLTLLCRFFFSKESEELASLISLVLFILYMVARVYLVIESFRSLFYASPAVFEQPLFAAYFPHFD